MALENAAVDDILAQIYSDIHVSTSGKANQKNFNGTSLTQDQAAIIGPIGKSGPLI